MAVSLFSILILFLVSLGSNATPFFGASYTIIATTALLADGFSLGNFVLIVLVTATGASLGKLVIYGGGKRFSGRLGQNKTVMVLGRLLERKMGLAVVFVTAIIPGLPLDDYLYVGAGASSSRLTSMFIITFLAKILKSFPEIGIEVCRARKALHGHGSDGTVSARNIHSLLSGILGGGRSILQG